MLTWDIIGIWQHVDKYDHLLAIPATGLCMETKSLIVTQILKDLCKPWLTTGDMSRHQGMFNYPNLYPFDQTTYKFEIDTNLYPFDADQLHMCHMQMLC
jgi:hypothetical protein